MVSSQPSPQRRVSFPPSNEDWGGWILAAASGDQDALGRLYDRTNRILFGLILRILRDRGSAEEVLVDVYLQVWRKGETYSATKGSPLAWLLTIARSRAIDALRSRTVREFAQHVPLETAGGVADGAPDPEENSAIAQRRFLIQRALASLSNDQREAIELAFFCGLSHTEIAEALGQPLGTIKTRVRLGMARLRESLLYCEGL